MLPISIHRGETVIHAHFAAEIHGGFAEEKNPLRVDGHKVHTYFVSPLVAGIICMQISGNAEQLGCGCKNLYGNLRSV